MLMENARLLQLLKEVLGEYKELNNGEYSFYSPFMNHRKKKLQIQLNPNSPKFGWWHCWISDTSGKKLRTLFKKVSASEHHFKKLAKLTGNKYYSSGNYQKSREDIDLPEEYLPIWKKRDTPEYKHAIHHLLKQRKLGLADIIKHRVGYCEKGEFKNRIIVPSYDNKGKLNYFVARSIFEGQYLKYKNPSAPKSQIIGFEEFVNWEYPITLVEGVFDAMAVKRNVIPLFGKSLTEPLKQKILEENVNDVYVCLDNDAFNDALDISEYLLNEGINVYLVLLNENEDPSDMGFEKITRKLKSTEKLTFPKLIEYKLWI